MVFLIILIVATAVLLAWALVSVTRVTLGDLRLPRLEPSPPQRPAVEGRPESSSITAAEPPAGGPTEIYDGSDAERAVREHLYGRSGRRA